MQITLNGENTTLENGVSITQMLENLTLDPRKIAVERNLQIVSRSAYDTTCVEEGDVLEIVHFMGGGKE